jgi:hypothetical protein
VVEQRGFEPLVPRKNGWPVLTTLIDLKALSSAKIKRHSRERDRQFEFPFLRRRVCLTGAFHGYRRKRPGFAGSVRLYETREWDVLATSRLALSPFL